MAGTFRKLENWGRAQVLELLAQGGKSFAEIVAHWRARDSEASERSVWEALIHMHTSEDVELTPPRPGSKLEFPPNDYRIECATITDMGRELLAQRDEAARIGRLEL